MSRSTGIGRGNNPASWNNTKKGKEHHRWNEGRIISSHGYVKIRVGTDHPLSDPNGYAYEHLLVWCAAGNPKPGDNEVLHHKNENKADNQLKNLHLMNRGLHIMEEHADRGTDGKLKSKNSGNPT